MYALERYYSILELEPGGSLEEINQAYRDLAFVWHPDRYTHNPRLQQKAQAKLQAVNEAHEHLCCHRTAPRRSPPPPQPTSPQPPPPPKAARRKTTQEPRTHHASAQQPKQEPQQEPQQEPRQQSRAYHSPEDFKPGRKESSHRQTSSPKDPRDHDKDHGRDFREPRQEVRGHIHMPCNNYNNCVWLD